MVLRRTITHQIATHRVTATHHRPLKTQSQATVQSSPTPPARMQTPASIPAKPTVQPTPLRPIHSTTQLDQAPLVRPMQATTLLHRRHTAVVIIRPPAPRSRLQPTRTTETTHPTAVEAMVTPTIPAITSSTRTSTTTSSSADGVGAGTIRSGDGVGTPRLGD